MTEEYVDVLGEKYTKMWKRIAYIRFFLKLFWCFIVCATLIIICLGLEPYIKGTQEWEYAPFTLSQLNAIFCLIVWCWMCSKAIGLVMIGSLLAPIAVDVMADLTDMGTDGATWASLVGVTVIMSILGLIIVAVNNYTKR